MGYGVSTPVVVNGIAYASDENAFVYVRNATGGAQLWNYLTRVVELFPLQQLPMG
jgi:outer membrane protein assembly factor BamB